MVQAQTVAQYISKLSDEDLQCVLEEVTKHVVPSTGATHTLIHRINRLIDKGELQINPSNYRRINMPSLIKFITHEASFRYLTMEKNLAIMSMLAKQSSTDTQLKFPGV